MGAFAQVDHAVSAGSARERNASRSDLRPRRTLPASLDRIQRSRAPLTRATNGEYAWLMKVVDHAAQWWFLFEEGSALFLDVNCSHSAFGYSFMIELEAEEVAHYRAEGRAFLERLAARIQDSAPILATSTSPYKGRDVSAAHVERTTQAVRAWRESDVGQSKRSGNQD
jgi:hypothetical protein